MGGSRNKLGRVLLGVERDLVLRLHGVDGCHGLFGGGILSQAQQLGQDQGSFTV